MSDTIKKTSRARQFSTALSIVVILLCLCSSTAFYPRGFPSASLATIPKDKIEANASREEIAEKLVNVWMGKYRIGTLGWSDWIWKYEIEKVDFWDSTSECVNVRIKVITVLPSDTTQWMGLYTKKDGMWLKNGYTMVVSEHDNYYELSGPYSLC